MARSAALPLAALALAAAADRAAPPPPPSLFFGFDAGFGDNMVLQRGPAAAAVYGFLDAPNASVTVTVSSGGTTLYTVDATLNATQQAFGPAWGVRPCPKAACPPYDMDTFTPFAYPLPTWKALLHPTAATPPGASYTITAVCTGCGGGGGAQTISIQNVAFGDVWFCSGQSNMWLPVQNTFTRNETARNISAGTAYTNIRMMAGSSGDVPYGSWPPTYGNGGAPKASNPWMTAAQAVPEGCVEAQSCPLFKVGATCWYTMQALAEGGVDVPLGILDTAIGGQRIEEFMVNSTVAACTQLSSQNIPWWNGQLYGQQTLPFVDMTLAGWLWYQGENNMGNSKGNVLAGVGYACAMTQLVAGWRAAWSATPGTTDPQAPFGVVTLASSGSEGGPNMGAMRLAQTGSYGVLPSPLLPNTFLAQAFDLDDEWGPESGPCWGPAPNWACCAGQGNKVYNATQCAGREALCAPSCAAQAGTAYMMGGIHPRSKHEVGERLGRAALNTHYGGAGAYTGPTLSSCSLSSSGGAPTLTVQFNTSLLRGDTLALQRIPSTPGSSQLFVQTNASLFCLEPLCVPNATSGRCATIDPSKPRSPTAYTCPVWAGGDGTAVQPEGVFDSNWIPLNFTAAPSGTAIVVDLSPLNGTAPTAVRYAWGIVDCCDHSDPTLYVTHGCVAACPIMSSSGLPANPFSARVVGGKCACVAPQVCDGGT